MLSALLLFALWVPAAQDEDPASPPKQQRVAGYWGLVVTSEVEVATHAYRLEVSYAFPARGRCVLTPVEGRATARTLTFRYGDDMWFVAAGAATSTIVPTSERPSLLRLLGLRRALVLWPEGFEWSGEGDQRQAALGLIGGQRIRLRALLSEDAGRPQAIQALDEAGRLLESLTDITWALPTEPGDRAWPSALTRRLGSRPVWRERNLQVARRRYKDVYFQPVDRRGGEGAPIREVRAFDLPAATIRRVELEPDLDLESALARADALVLEAVERAPDRIDPSPTLLLDRSGRAVEVWITRRGGGAAPEGWEERPAGEALGLFLEGMDAWGGREAGGLRQKALERGRKPGVLFLRIRPPGEHPRRAELVQVLEPD